MKARFMQKTGTGTIVAIALLLAGCGNQGQQSSGPATSGSGAPGAMTNPTDFPLAADAKILSARPFTQTVSASSGSALASRGAGTYKGDAVIAQSSGSLADTKAWLAKTESTPPAGYTHVSAAQDSHAVAIAAKYGVTYGVFKSGTKSAVIAVIDPKLAHEKLGIALDLVDKYQMVPAPLRESIDSQVKQRIGVSVTEALDPSAPIGMTIAALKQVNGSDQPAIVEVDATKE